MIEAILRASKANKLKEQSLAEGPKWNVAESNHWYDAGVKDAKIDAKRYPDSVVKKLNPRTYLPTMKDKQAKHPEEIHHYTTGYRSVKQGVAEGKEDNIKQLKADYATAVHWSKNETSPQKREAARRKAETIKAHLEKQYKQGVAEDATEFEPLEELANTSLKVKEPKNFVNTNDRKQVVYKVMKFKSGKDTYLINFTVKSAPAFGKKQNWNALNVAFGVREEQDDYSFGDEIDTDLTAKNKNQFLIYSTVINAVRKFITEYNTEIDEIIMQGAGERQVVMYQRFFKSVSKYFPGWHYDGKHSLVRDVPRQKMKKVNESSYAGNIGIIELVKFHQKASSEQKKMLQSLINSKKAKDAWKLVQDVTGVKLHKSVQEGISPDILPKSGAGADGTATLVNTYKNNTPGQGRKVKRFKEFN